MLSNKYKRDYIEFLLNNNEARPVCDIHLLVYEKIGCAKCMFQYGHNGDNCRAWFGVFHCLA